MTYDNLQIMTANIYAKRCNRILDMVRDIPSDAITITLHNSNKIDAIQYDRLQIGDSLYILVYSLDKYYSMRGMFDLSNKYDKVQLRWIESIDWIPDPITTEVKAIVVDPSTLPVIKTIKYQPCTYKKNTYRYCCKNGLIIHCKQKVVTCKSFLEISQKVVIIDSNNNVKSMICDGTEQKDSMITLFKTTSDIEFVELDEDQALYTDHDRIKHIKKIIKRSTFKMDCDAGILTKQLSHLSLIQINNRIRDTICRMARANQTNDFVITSLDITDC